MMVLEGIRVIDWTNWQAGPIASEMLGDFGAEVIKVEQRGVGDPGRGMMYDWGNLAADRNYYYEINNRNKKCITLDLTKPQASEIMRRLVEKSDVFVQNFRKGVAEKYELDYESLHQVNPRLVYASATGLGEKGPESYRPTMDPIGILRSGFSQLGNLPDQSPLCPAGSIADQLNGWSLAHGIVMALLARERYGVGQKVTSSFLGSMMWLQGLVLGSYLYTGTPQPPQCRKESRSALANFYRCADGKWLALYLVQADRHWPSFCEAAGLTHLVDDPRFVNLQAQIENREALVAILDEVFATKTLVEWTDILSRYPDFIYGGSQSTIDMVRDPQVIANDGLVDYDHPVLGKVRVVAPPVSLSETPWSMRLPAPEFGEHTEEVLIEVCGYTWEELGRLREDEVI